MSSKEVIEKEMISSYTLTGLYRIIDATINRAREALRVIEDAARFVCDDSTLTADLKSMRHEFARMTTVFPREDRMTARDTACDVGTTLQTDDEYLRSSIPGVVTANFARLQESLRSMEEYAKMLSPEIAVCIENLRYRSYTLEKRMDEQLTPSEPQRSLTPLRLSRLKRLARSSVYALLDTKTSDARFLEYVRAGVDIIQLRDKRASDRAILETARRWSSRLRDYKEYAEGAESKEYAEYIDSGERVTQFRCPLLIMNDRPDLAVCSNFDGVHVGQKEIRPEDARYVMGASLLIGVSTFNMDEVVQALDSKADYLGAGPIFPSKTKKCKKLCSTTFLNEFARADVTVPVFAIGGIDLDNVGQVVSSGIRRVSVCSVLSGSTDVAATTNALKALLSSNP